MFRRRRLLNQARTWPLDFELSSRDRVSMPDLLEGHDRDVTGVFARLSQLGILHAKTLTAVPNHIINIARVQALEDLHLVSLQ